MAKFYENPIRRQPGHDGSLWPKPPRRSQDRKTNIDFVLSTKVEWDQATWDVVEQYLLSRVTQDDLFFIVSMTGGDVTRAFSKADLVQLLHGIPPQEVLSAWENWREYGP